MSVHALLNLFNKSRKRDKMRGLRDVLYATILYIHYINT